MQMWWDIFNYDPATGVLVWKIKTSNRIKVGSVAGYVNKKGYVVVCRKHLAHRVIWEMHNGEIPPGMEIDHINHVKTDNRLINLRLVPSKQNKRNYPLYSNNTSSVAGVSWDASRGKWRVDVSKRCIGRFLTFEDAVKARTEQLLKEGYHENHGK